MASATGADAADFSTNSSFEQADSVKNIKQAFKQARLLQGPDELCERCRDLRISHRAFIVSDQDALPRQHNTGALRTGMGDIELQPYDNIVECADTCGLCRLIVKAIKKCDPGLDTRPEVKCYLRWEVDGHREVDPNTFQNRTRRLRLLWSSDGARRSEAFLVLVAQTPAGLPNSDAARRKGRVETFTGKEVLRGQGKQALIKSWLDICGREHKNACGIATQRFEFERLVSETYFGVIDVTDLQLKPLLKDSKGKYAKFVALSYVWGSPNKSYTTTRLNVPLRRQHGGIEKDLEDFPAVIKDAIRLVQKLNIRYLWVDAICIVQDSPASWRLNAADMHVIYGNAHFTICAADGSDADTGLLAMDTDIKENLDARDSEEILPGLRLQIARPPEIVIQESTWNSRGWTYQERILSRRCVIFADGRAYFQCRKTAFSEDIHNDARGSGWSLQAMGAPLGYFIEIETRCFAFYMKSVGLYYNRGLTKPGDILAAYKGIQSVMELVMYAPFVYGLPSSHFDLALLWEPRQPIRRRVAERQEFPSWSWCGWEGGKIDYLPATLEGALVSVREWLTNHTWIRYHVLDGRGQLRPLWDRERVLEDNSREHRWRGYIGLPAKASETLPVRDNSSSEEASQPFNTCVGSSDNSSDDGDERDEYRKRYELRDLDRRKAHLVPYKYGTGANHVPEGSSLSYGHGRYDQPESGYGFLQRDVKTVVQGEAPTLKEHLAEGILQIVMEDRRRAKRRPDPSRSRGDVDLEDIEFSDDSSLPREQINALSERLDSIRTEIRVQPLNTHHLVIDHGRGKSRGAKIKMPTERQNLDRWGRKVGKFCKDDRYMDDVFSRTHPENPYRVKKTEWTKPDTSMGLQDLPILQFWTKLKRLRILVHAEVSGTGDGDYGLMRCHIGDAADDWCGSVVVDKEWSKTNNGRMVTFIALSEAKSFTVEEGSDWNYYTPRERSESEWEVVYALLVEMNEAKHVWERVGLAKVFKGAFSGDWWQEIMLG